MAIFSSPIMTDISPLIATLEARLMLLNRDPAANAPFRPEAQALVEQIRSIKNLQEECSRLHRVYACDKSNSLLAKKIEQNLQMRDDLIELFKTNLLHFLAMKAKA